MKRALYMGFVALFLCSVSTHAEAQTSVREIESTWVDGQPEVSFDLSSMVDAHVRREISSGLTRTLAVQVLAYRRRGGRPIAVAQITVRILYDLWEDEFRVQRSIGSRSRTVTQPTLQAAIAEAFSVRQQPVGNANTWSRHAGDDIYFAVVAEFNPISNDTVRQVRRLISRRNNHSVENSTVGSFVSLFVNQQIGSADRVLRFRSSTRSAEP